MSFGVVVALGRRRFIRMPATMTVPITEKGGTRVVGTGLIPTGRGWEDGLRWSFTPPGA